MAEAMIIVDTVFRADHIILTNRMDTIIIDNDCNVRGEEACVCFECIEEWVSK